MIHSHSFYIKQIKVIIDSIHPRKYFIIREHCKYIRMYICRSILITIVSCKFVFYRTVLYFTVRFVFLDSSFCIHTPYFICPGSIWSKEGYFVAPSLSLLYHTHYCLVFNVIICTCVDIERRSTEEYNIQYY